MTETGTEARQVEREAVLDVDLDRAWEAISDPDVLSEWLADEVDLEAVEGAPATFTFDGDERPGRVERVEERRGLSFTWEREEGRSSLVELRLTPCYRGVRISVRETDLGATSRVAARMWATPLARLRAVADLVPA